MKKKILNISSNDIRDTMNKKYIDFTKAIEQLGGKLLYIKSGSTGHTLKEYIKYGKPNYGVKIVAYPKKKIR